jgi:hypothetical protein
MDRARRRAALESALAENVRGSDAQCEGLIEIIVERVVPCRPTAPIGPSKEREFEVSDWS